MTRPKHGRRSAIRCRLPEQLLLPALLAGLTACSAATGQSPPPSAAATPYSSLSAQPYRYHGPRDGAVDPANLTTVRLGLLVPRRGPRAELGRSISRGAELAITEVNRSGGLDGLAFSLVRRPDDLVWGSAREVVRLAYDDQVWAVIGAAGGQSSHVAEQVITKAQLVLVSPASTDSSLTRINIPWMFRLLPDDRRIATLLAEHLGERLGLHRVVTLASLAADRRHQAAAFEGEARRHGLTVQLSLRCRPSGDELGDLVERLRAVPAEAVVLFLSPARTTQVLELLELLDQQQHPIVVAAVPGLTMGTEAAQRSDLAAQRSDLAAQRSDLAAQLLTVAACDLWRADPVLERFVTAYQTRYGVPPDCAAAAAYDTVHLLVAAIRTAGLDRAAIRDALAAVSHHGALGAISFDGTGASSVGPVLVSRDQEGRCRPVLRLPAP